MSDLSLGFDIDSGPAQDTLDAFGSQLDQVVSAFGSGLGAALDVLSDIVVAAPDTTAVTQGISDAVSQADTVIAPNADTGPMQSEIESALDQLDPPPIEVGVTADTSGVQGQLDDLGSSADEATGSSSGGGGVAGLSFGLGELTSKAKEAGATSGEAAGEIGGIAGVALPAVAGVAAVAGGIAELTKEGISAVGAQQRYNQVLGAFGKQVNDIHIQGFTGNLEDLAQAVGSTVPNLQNATTHIFTLGTSSGAAAPQVAETTQQVALLAARAVALRPSLGDVGAVADRMSTILATGGRRAQQYGISLTSAQIAARAMQIAVADGRSEVTQFDKVAAGAAITTETLGSKLGKDIGSGAKNAEVQVKQLQSTFETSLEKFGAPLVVPVLQTIKDLTPLATSLFGLIGKIGEAIIPALDPGIKALSTVLQPVIAALSQELTDLAPTIQEVGTSLAGVVTSTLPLFQGLATVIKDLEPVTNFLFKGLAADLDAVSSAVSGTISFFQTLAGFDKTADLATNVTNLQKSIKDVGDEAAKSGKEIDPLTAGVERFVATSSRFQARNQVDDLGRLGITYKQLGADVDDGTTGLVKFVQKAQDAGEIGVPQSVINSFKDGKTSLSDFVLSISALGKGNTDLVKSFIVTQAAVQKYSQTQIDAGVASGEFTAKQAKAAEAATKGTTGIVDYQKAFKGLSTAVDDSAIAQANIVAPTAAAGAAADTSATSWVSLADAIANNTIDSSTFDTVAQQFGISQANITTFASQVTAAVQNMDTEASAALNDFGDAVEVNFGKVDPGKVIQNLIQQTQAIQNFSKNAAQAAADGNNAVFQEAVKEGAVKGGALLDAYTQATPEIKKQLNDALQAQQDAAQNNVDTIKTLTPEAVAATQAQGEQQAQAYARAFDLAHQTDTAVSAGVQVLTSGDQAAAIINAGGVLGTGAATKFGGQFVIGMDGQVVFIQASTTSTLDTATKQGAAAVDATPYGLPIGEGLGTGITQGITRKASASAITNAVVTAVGDAQSQIYARLGIASPSKVWADLIGEPLGLGIAMGIGRTGDFVSDASTAIVKQAGLAAQSAVVSSATAFASRAQLVGSGGQSSTGSSLVINVPVTLAAGMTPEDGKAIGAAAAGEVVTTLSRRGILASIRVS